MRDQTLGAWLKARREALHLTLRDVERITDGKISNAYLSQVETGKVAAISAINLHRLCAAYALDFAEALQRAGDPKPPTAPKFCPMCGAAIVGFQRAQQTEGER